GAILRRCVRLDRASGQRAGPAAVSDAAGTLADHQGIAGAVRDVGDARPAVAVKDAVAATFVLGDWLGTEHADVVGSRQAGGRIRWDEGQGRGVRRTEVNRQALDARHSIGVVADVKREVDLSSQVALFEVVEQIGPPAPAGADADVCGVDARYESGRKRAHAVVIVVHGQPNLLEVVEALRPAGRFPNPLHGG